MDDRSQPTAAEFFAGMGLVRRAMEADSSAPGRSTRWRTVFANDYDPLKQRLYAATFADTASIWSGADIRTLAASDIPRVDLWTASFPCTDLSLAGGRGGIHRGQSGAVWELLRLLKETPPSCRPAALLFENVTGLLSSRTGEASGRRGEGDTDFHALVRAVNGVGYAVEPLLVDASWFTPQSRPRLYLLAEPIGAHPPADLDDARSHPARPARVLSAMRNAPGLRWHARPLPPLPNRAATLESIIADPSDDSPLWWGRERAAYFLAQVHPGHQAEARRRIAADAMSHATAFRRVRPCGPGGEKRSVIELRTDGLAGCLRLPKGGSAKQIVFRAGRGRFAVRHMTPAECGRLQGVNDLALPLDGMGAGKAGGAAFSPNEALTGLGDAVCVPAARWALDVLAGAGSRDTALSPGLAGSSRVGPCPMPSAR